MILVLNRNVIGHLSVKLVYHDRSKRFAVISGRAHEELVLLLVGRPTEIIIDLLLQLVFDLLLHGVSHAFLLWYLAHLGQGTHLQLDSGPSIVDIGSWNG